MRGALSSLALVAVLAAPLAAHPEGTALEVLDLAYRKAGGVLPVLQPLVEGGGLVSALGNQLAIRATARGENATRALPGKPAPQPTGAAAAAGGVEARVCRGCSAVAESRRWHLKVEGLP